MKPVAAFLIRVVLLAFILCVLRWAINTTLSSTMDALILIGGPLSVYPAVWLGRAILDRRRTMNRAAWTTTIVHASMMFTLGVPIARAIVTHRHWSVWVLHVPAQIGFALVLITSAACSLTVVNLAMRGLGAPFFVALSRKLAADWLYAWTRNPMVLTVLALGVSLGIWFQSALFVLWVLVLLAPALLTFVKIFEERELEIRFGSSYLEYKSRTPMVFPRRPKKLSDLPPGAPVTTADEPLSINH